MAEASSRRISSQGANPGRKLSAPAACALDPDFSESSCLSTCLAQGNAPRCSVSSCPAVCLEPGTRCRIASLRGIRCFSDIGLRASARGPALEDPGAASHCGSGQRAACTQCRRRRRALQVPGHARSALEDMEFEQDDAERFNSYTVEHDAVELHRCRGKVIDIGKCFCNDSHELKEHRIAMTFRKRALFIAILGIGASAGYFGYHTHIENVRAAKLEHLVATKPFFPAGSLWTQDVGHAPVDPQSSTIIAWLADAGGWGTGKMRVDFSLRMMEADAKTPFVPFKPGPSFYAADSDKVSAFPLPAGGGLELEDASSYKCPTDQDDCHLDRKS